MVIGSFRIDCTYLELRSYHIKLLHKSFVFVYVFLFQRLKHKYVLECHQGEDPQSVMRQRSLSVKFEGTKLITIRPLGG